MSDGGTERRYEMEEETQLGKLSCVLKDIKRTQERIFGSSFESVVQYCIDKHDKSLTRLLEMQKFLEDNIDLFYRPNEPLSKRDEQDSRYGWGNPRNKVVIYNNTERQILIVWVDGGVHFWYNFSTSKVVFIGNNLECPQSEFNWGEKKGHTMGQYEKYFHFDSYNKDGSYPTEGYERFFVQPTSLEVKPGTESSFEMASELKRTVDEDSRYVEVTYQALLDCVGQIQKDEAEYLGKMNTLLGEVKETGK